MHMNKDQKVTALGIGIEERYKCVELEDDNE